MAGGSEILREYLLSLGFKIDGREERKFHDTLGKFDFNVAGLAKRLLAAGVAAQTMTTLWARSMERLYYSSQRIGDTAGKIQALEYAGKQVGVGADAMRGALEGMARSMRAQPGLVGLLRDLGIKVDPNNRTKMLTDLVDRLRSFPTAIAQQFAAMFGMDPDTYFMLSQNVDKLKEAAALREQMAKDAGLDVDAAAKAGLEYSQAFSRITEQAGILKDTLMVQMVGPMKTAALETEKILQTLTAAVRMMNTEVSATGIGGLAKKLMEGIGGKATGDRVELSASSKQRLGLIPSGRAPSAGGAGGGFKWLEDLRAGAAEGSKEAKRRYLETLNDKYGLPSGFLQRMWKQESGEGSNMTSRAGARGDFQFMPKTAEEEGVDVNDFKSSADGAARYMSKLMKRYGGDLQKSTAAYNWGMGNVDKQGLAKAPWETRDYVNKLTGQPITIQQTNQITITAPDAAAAGAKVGQALDRANADLTRNFQGAVQ